MVTYKETVAAEESSSFSEVDAEEEEEEEDGSDIYEMRQERAELEDGRPRDFQGGSALFTI